VRQTGCKDTAFSHSTKLYDKSFDFYFQENLSGKLKFIQLNCFLINKLLNHFNPQSFSLKAAAKVMLIFKLPNFLRKIISFLFDTFSSPPFQPCFSLKAGAKVLTLYIQTKSFYLLFLL